MSQAVHPAKGNAKGGPEPRAPSAGSLETSLDLTLSPTVRGGEVLREKASGLKQTAGAAPKSLPGLTVGTAAPAVTRGRGPCSLWTSPSEPAGS